MHNKFSKQTQEEGDTETIFLRLSKPVILTIHIITLPH